MKEQLKGFVVSESDRHGGYIKALEDKGYEWDETNKKVIKL